MKKVGAKKKAATKAKSRVKAGTSTADKEKRVSTFIEAMVSNGGNATEAAKTAGYSPKTARQQGSRLLSDVSISMEIDRRRREAVEKAAEATGVSVAGIMQQLSKLLGSDLRKAFGANGELLPPHLWPDDLAPAIASVEVVEMAGGLAVDGEDGVRHVPMYTKKVKLWDKNSAIDKAMKHLGLFDLDNVRRLQMTGRNGGPVEAVAVSPDEAYKRMLGG